MRCRPVFSILISSLLKEGVNVTDTGESPIPVSKERLDICLESAEFWAKHLGQYSAKLQARSDFCAIAAPVLSAVTAGSLWAVVTSTKALWAQLLVGAMAALSALFAAAPKARNYKDGAAKAARLNTEYGDLYGSLLDASRAMDNGASPPDHQVHELVGRLAKVKAERATLHPIPRSLERQRSKVKRQHERQPKAGWLARPHWPQIGGRSRTRAHRTV